MGASRSAITVRLPQHVFDKMRRVSQVAIVESKHVGAALAIAQAIQELRPHHRKRNNKEPARSSVSFTIFPPPTPVETAKVDRRRLCTLRFKGEPRLTNDDLIAHGLGEYVREGFELSRFPCWMGNFGKDATTRCASQIPDRAMILLIIVLISRD